MGIGSQLDGLGHLGIDFVYDNGHKEAEFLFVLGQPKFEGAVQAIINPVAIR